MGKILHAQLLTKVIKTKKPQVTKSQGFFGLVWTVGGSTFGDPYFKVP
jgi:hypothetical protein